ncbi:unnamed protein product [Menidia menidia]|uniref:(Atlantic silverside) hypothetical protein n=1 Tax=Menidia menidia TaxID=238744 RepID=A0A8S4AAB7_9TELE|nr:unnamed protein product [Menidia menidia]
MKADCQIQGCGVDGNLKWGLNSTSHNKKSICHAAWSVKLLSAVAEALLAGNTPDESDVLGSGLAHLQVDSYIALQGILQARKYRFQDMKCLKISRLAKSKQSGMEDWRNEPNDEVVQRGYGKEGSGQEEPTILSFSPQCCKHTNRLLPLTRV